jgi:hypothetical protein
MITFPSHTSHALKPLDFSCFRPFKFAKDKYDIMFKNNYRKSNKVTLAGWVDRALN